MPPPVFDTILAWIYYVDMSKEEADTILSNLNEYVKETTASKESALAALVAAGIVKPTGELEEAYRA